MILTYLNSLIAEVFPHHYFTIYLFRFQSSLVGNVWSTLYEKCKLWIRLFFIKTRILQIFFKQFFCLVEYCYLWWGSLDHIWTIFGRVRASKNPKNRESVRKTLKNFNLTTKNAIPMKLTTIMYLYECVNRKRLRARNSVFLA